MSIMEEKVASLKSQIENFAGKSAAEIEEFRLKYISKKGAVSLLFDDLKNVPVEQKKAAGQLLNDLKKTAEAKFTLLSESAVGKESAGTEIDLSLPSVSNKTGNLHPLTLTRFRIIEVFERLGFSVEDGPEIEDDWHNFS